MLLHFAWKSNTEVKGTLQSLHHDFYRAVNMSFIHLTI